jgi:hypothetical protein
VIRDNTILILGAGASMDYGFPSGERLIQDIINFLRGSTFKLWPEQKKMCVALALQRYYKTKLDIDKELNYCLDKIEKFVKALIHASPASIDDFIDKNREEGFDIISKICVVLCISSYEKPDETFFLQQEATHSTHHYYKDSLSASHWEIREGWYRHLWKKIYEGNDVRENLGKLTFISFNYDRSLEYFLYTSFVYMLGFDPEKAAKLFDNYVSIYHVYGQIGYLDWQKGGVKNSYDRLTLESIIKLVPTKEFEKSKLISGQLFIGGIEKPLDHILSIANEIKTYTEAADMEHILLLDKIPDATRLFFFGFGYHSQNLYWLKTPMKSFNGHMYGTAYEFGKSQLINTTANLRTFFPNGIVQDHFFSPEHKIKDYCLHVQDIV